MKRELGFNKKLTNEDFLKDIEEIYGENAFKVITPYTKSGEKVTIYCVQGEHEFSITPWCLLNNGCPICNKINMGKKRKEAYEKELKDFLNNFSIPTQIVGEYEGQKVKTMFYCEECDLYFETTPQLIIKRLKNGWDKHLHFNVPITPSMFYQMFKNNFDIEEYELKSEYKGLKKEIEIYHKKCNRTYTTKAEYVWEGHKCPFCSKGQITEEDFLAIMKELDPDGEYEILSEFIDLSSTKIHLKHTCGYDYWVIPNNFIIGRRCAFCQNLVPVSEEEAKRRIKEKYNGDIEILTFSSWGEYGWVLCHRCGTKSYKLIKSLDQQKIGCEVCKRLIEKGPGDILWEGEVVHFDSFMRERCMQWKIDSKMFYNNRCVITGKTTNLIVHHVIKSFVDIRNEVLEEFKIDKNSNFLEIKKETMWEIAEAIRKKHYQYGYGIPLDADLHREFHSKYGNKNNTVEQFIEFAESKGVKLSLLDNYLIKGDIIDEDE